ncbi:MAG: hypothetical protein AAFW73_03360 [Bacteroidota bacterium]
MMIKSTLVVLLLASLCPLLTAQQELETGESFGIDIMPAFITLGGGTNSYEEVELIYRARNDKQGQLRLKLNVNNRPVVTNELVYAEELKTPCGGVNPTLSSRYTPSQNILVAAGLGKYIPNANFPLYYGLDLNLGVNRGRVESIQEVCSTNDTLFVQNLANTKTFTYLVGVTPVLGTELSLNRLSLIIEFGFMVNYNFGRHPYLDAEGNEQEVPISRMDLLFSRLLNDFAIVYRF